MRNRITDLHLRRSFDTGDQVTHIAGGKHILWNAVHLKDADFVRVVLMIGGEKLHHLVRSDRAVEDTEVGDDTAEGVENGVEDESLQRSLRVTFRRGNALNDGLQDLLHALSCLTTCLNDIVNIATK